MHAPSLAHLCLLLIQTCPEVTWASQASTDQGKVGPIPKRASQLSMRIVEASSGSTALNVYACWEVDIRQGIRMLHSRP